MVKIFKNDIKIELLKKTKERLEKRRMLDKFIREELSISAQWRLVDLFSELSG